MERSDVYYTGGRVPSNQRSGQLKSGPAPGRANTVGLGRSIPERLGPAHTHGRWVVAQLGQVMTPEIQQP